MHDFKKNITRKTSIEIIELIFNITTYMCSFDMYVKHNIPVKQHDLRG
jgi:hypothetical protein